jgi:peptidoglycan/xylan/chitin deacetylase (PgdA/CDA1 family)
MAKLELGGGSTLRAGSIAAVAGGLTLAFAGAAAAEPKCPTDPLAPLVTPKVQLEAQARPGGGPASYGGMQYQRTPGLGPKDIALTVDDGPSPQVTPLFLKILAKHCLKTTYFLVGWYAHAYPELVRQEADAGHFIGTHTYTHPDNIRRLSTAAAEAEIDNGIQAARDALANGTPAEKAQLAPFFRFPGLTDPAELRGYVAKKNFAVVGADFGADDWKNISPAAVEHHALVEAAAVHGGILILHDSHMRTALALDDLITTFEQDGYRFVQLVPAQGAPARAELGDGGPIFGSTASAGPRDPAHAKGPSLSDRAQALAKDWGARLSVFGHWIWAKIGHLWSQLTAQLRH